MVVAALMAEFSGWPKASPLQRRVGRHYDFIIVEIEATAKPSFEFTGSYPISIGQCWLPISERHFHYKVSPVKSPDCHHLAVVESNRLVWNLSWTAKREIQP